MQRILQKFFIFLVAALSFFPFLNAISGYTDTKSLSAIVGYWETLDDRTEKPAGVIKIWQQKGKFYGKLVHSYSKGEASRCFKCKDARRNQPVLGMTLIRDAYYKSGKYINGRILDPRSGGEYRIQMWVVDHGCRLKVRGYLGLPVLGKTMYWKRVEKPKGTA